MKSIKLLAVLALVLFTMGCGVEQVDEGFRGIKTTWGKVEGEPLTPGLYFYNPISSGIFEMDVKEHKWEGEESCFTSDTQEVKVKFATTAYPQLDKIGTLYSQFGKGWEEKIIPQVIQTAIKDVVGQYRADDLVSKREEARTAALKELQASLVKRGVVVTGLDFTNLDFNDAYEHAIEAKVVATQRSLEAKNKTVQVREEADQKVLAAKADAEAMRIKSQALSQNKGLVQYEAVQRWNGQLPTYMFGNSTPILNLSSFSKNKTE